MILVDQNSFSDTAFPQLFVENINFSHSPRRWEVTVSAYLDNSLQTALYRHKLKEIRVCVVRIQDLGQVIEVANIPGITNVNLSAFEAYTKNLFSDSRDPLYFSKDYNITNDTVLIKEENLRDFTIATEDPVTSIVEIPPGIVKVKKQFYFNYDGYTLGTNIHFAFFPFIKTNDKNLKNQQKPESVVYGPLKIIQATDSNLDYVQTVNGFVDQKGIIWAGAYHIMEENGVKKYMKGLVHEEGQEELTLQTLSIPSICTESDLNTITTSMSFYWPSIAALYAEKLDNTVEVPITFGGREAPDPDISNIASVTKIVPQASSMSSGKFGLTRSLPVSNQSSLVKSGISTSLKTPEVREPDTLLKLQPVNLSQQDTRVQKSPFLNLSNTSTKVKKSRPIKNGSTIYSSVDINNSVSSVFAVDKINALMNYSKFSKVLKNLTNLEYEEILSRTNIKSISIERHKKDGRSLIAETVFDQQVPQVETTSANTVEHYSNNVFRTGEKQLISIFKSEQSLSSNRRTKFYSFVDYRSNSTIQDNFIYRAEIELKDGLEEYILAKTKTFLKNLRNLKNLYGYLEKKQVFISAKEAYLDGGYNFQLINKLPTAELLGIMSHPSSNEQKENINYLEDKYKIIVGSYIDIANLFVPKLSRNTGGGIKAILKEISVSSGTKQKLELFINDLEKFKNKLLNSLERKPNKLERSITKSKRTGRERNKRKNIKFVLHSESVKLIRDKTNPIDYFSDILDRSNGIPFVSRTTFATNVNLSNPLISPKNLYADGVKTVLADNQPIDNIIAMNNQANALINLNVRQGYITNNEESEDSIEELILKDRALQSLADIGVYVKEQITIKPVKNIISNISKPATAFKTNISTGILTKSSSLITSVSSFNRSIPVQKKELDINVKPIEKQKNLDFDYEIADLAVDFLLSDLIDKRKTKQINVKDLPQYAMNNCFNSRVQYLTDFEIVNGINTFKEKWVSIDKNQDIDIVTKNTLCRVHPIENNRLNLKLRSKFNVINLNQYFILSSGQTRTDSQLRKAPTNVYFSGELGTMSEETKMVISDDERNPIKMLAYNVLAFNVGIPINQTLNVKVFGTNFAPTPENIIYGTKQGLPSKTVSNVATTSVNPTANTTTVASGQVRSRQIIGPNRGGTGY